MKAPTPQPGNAPEGVLAPVQVGPPEFLPPMAATKGTAPATADPQPKIEAS